MAVSHTGRVLTSPSNAARSVVVGVRNSFSPPPSTSTALLTVPACAASAVTLTLTVMSEVEVTPALSTSELRHSKRVSPTAPEQVQPLPDGTCARFRPTGRRSLTMYSPFDACCPPLRTRMV
ncbi:hypothetical protein D3C81_1873320 [compost metagenome]